MLKKLHVNSENSESVSLWFLFWNFFKIGSTAFGGFMALISVVENRMVRRHKLLTHEDMLDGISLATVLPGPVAANVVAYVGYRLGRTNGAVVSAIGVLLPSFILVIGLTIAYLQAGEIPALQKAFAGFIPAVAAIILSAARRMSKKAIKGWRELVIALIAAVLLKVVGGFYITVLVVVGSGLLGWLWLGDTKHSGQENSQGKPIQESIEGISWLKLSVTLLILLSFLLLSLIPLPFLGETSLGKLFVTFSGMSLMLFGGGYVFIPLIQEVVVNNYGWVTQTEFANAIAIGQITPGPILISAAFIGYVVKGISGAIVATVGIFLPPGLLMVTCSHLLKHIKESTVIQAALKGIRPAVIGMIITAAIVVAGSAEFHVGSLVIFAAALVALWRFRVKVLLIIPISGILGLVLYSI